PGRIGTGAARRYAESGRTEVRPYMGQSGRGEEYPLRLAPPIYPDRAGTGRGKFRGRYRDDGRKMATSRFYRDKFRWPLQEDAAVLTMVPDRVRTGLACAAEQRTGRIACATSKRHPS